VKNYLFGYKTPMLREIEVEAFGARAVLRGRPRLYYREQLCMSCCLRVAGVRTVDDQIVVEPDNVFTAPIGGEVPGKRVSDEPFSSRLAFSQSPKA
jgi:hypothetical protein